jgi:peptidoglycan/xylan/chitin deacetylase (PgdA/CDA1 family)
VAVLFAALFAPNVQAQANLNPPRFVLNRSMFLHWDQYAGSDFASYVVYASRQPGFSPGSATRIAEVTDATRAYLDVRDLNPDTVYYFRLRIARSGGASYDSQEASARSLADGMEDGIPILMLHNVQPLAEFPAGYDNSGWLSAESFEELLAYFSTHNIHGITHREYADWKDRGIPLPPNPVLLSFDDGYRNFIEHAVPLLVAYDCIAVNAIVTGFAGMNNTWALPEWPSLPLMTWTEIKECRRNGFWLGSHTQTHADLRHETAKVFEIAASRDDIVNHLGVHPGFFTYPWGLGYGDGWLHEELQRRNYTSALGTFGQEDQRATLGSNRYSLPRVFTFADESLSSLLQRMETDSDKDGLRDGDELTVYNTDSAKFDTDGDGYGDGTEVRERTNPLLASSYPLIGSAMLRAGMAVQSIDMPGSLVPGQETVIQWQILSYVPVVSALRIKLPGDASSAREITVNAMLTGVEDGRWYLSQERSRIYSFECRWTVPNVPGTCRVRFVGAREDGFAYMNANIAAGVDARPYGVDGKEILRDIAPGSLDMGVTTEDVRTSTPFVETLDQAVLRAGSTAQMIEFPDYLAAGSTAMCSWELLSYVPIRSRVRIALPSGGIHMAEGTRVGSGDGRWQLSNRRAKAYRFQYQWTVPDDPGNCRVRFVNAEADGQIWMNANVPGNVDGRPHDSDGKEIRRTIVGP